MIKLLTQNKSKGIIVLAVVSFLSAWCVWFRIEEWAWTGYSAPLIGFYFIYRACWGENAQLHLVNVEFSGEEERGKRLLIFIIGVVAILLPLLLAIPTYAAM